MLIVYAGTVKKIQMFRCKFASTRSTGIIQKTSKMTLRLVHIFTLFRNVNVVTEVSTLHNNSGLK